MPEPPSHRPDRPPGRRVLRFVSFPRPSRLVGGPGRAWASRLLLSTHGSTTTVQVSVTPGAVGTRSLYGDAAVAEWIAEPHRWSRSGVGIGFVAVDRGGGAAIDLGVHQHRDVGQRGVDEARHCRRAAVGAIEHRVLLRQVGVVVASRQRLGDRVRDRRSDDAGRSAMQMLPLASVTARRGSGAVDRVGHRERHARMRIDDRPPVQRRACGPCGSLAHRARSR